MSRNQRQNPRQDGRPNASQDVRQDVRQNMRQNMRLTVPLVRDSKGESLRPATWDEALDRAAAGFQAVVAAKGPGAFGMFSCSKTTNEMNFIAQKFTRVAIGSNNVDSCNRT